ncbi:UNVERIFIED_CONTAM: hypothetical protein K2H54_038860 [Gekko kuhli]
MGAKKPPRDGAEAEPGLLSLLSRLGPVPRAAEETETPLPLQLAAFPKIVAIGMEKALRDVNSLEETRGSPRS